MEVGRIGGGMFLSAAGRVRVRGDVAALLGRVDGAPGCKQSKKKG